MQNSNMSEKEKKVFQTGLFDNLTVQDAFTIIALYAARLDINDGEKELAKLIMTFLSKDVLFDEDKSSTIDRINKFTNSMAEVNPLNAVERAAKVLTPELRQMSFRIAAQVSKAAQEIRTTKILERLASKLTIEKAMVERTINSIITKGC